MAGKTRRSKKEIIIDKINTCDKIISDMTGKMEAVKIEREALTAQLNDIIETEKKAKEEATMKELMSLIKKNNVDIDELKDYLINKKK